MLAPRAFRLVYAKDDEVFRKPVLTVLNHAGVEVFLVETAQKPSSSANG